MHSASGRYVITYYGEIFNYKIFRKDLIGLGNKFIGTSDTEVVLAAFENGGG